MTVKLIAITPDAEEIMVYCARVSSDNQDNPEYESLLKYCIKHKHWSVFEHASMTVEIETTRAISPQILRHRSFTFQEFSQRYANASKMGVELQEARRQDQKNRQNSIDDLSQDVKDEWKQKQEALYDLNLQTYNWAIENGIAKECARAVLPLNVKTKLYMTGNIRDWIHYVNLRSGNGTQKEHMDIALQIKKIMAEKLPTVAKALDWI